MVQNLAEGSLEGRCANPNCGEIISGAPSFCPRCGTRQAGPTGTHSTPETAGADGSLVGADDLVTENPDVSEAMVKASPVQISASQIAWMAASAIAIIAGFFVIHARPATAPAPSTVVPQASQPVVASPTAEAIPTPVPTNTEAQSTQPAQTGGDAASAAVLSVVL